MWNYSAGPGMMPEEVLRQIQEEVWDCAHSGVGILEHSHRGPVYDKILAEALADCRAPSAAGIPDDWDPFAADGAAVASAAPSMPSVPFAPPAPSVSFAPDPLIAPAGSESLDALFGLSGVAPGATAACVTATGPRKT